MRDSRSTCFTVEEQESIRAHIRARGMTFEAFLPERLADWLRKRIAAGVYAGPSEAAFVAFLELRALDRHPHVRRALLQAQIESALADPSPGISAEELSAKVDAQLRTCASTEPPPAGRRWRTGCNQQININAKPEVIARFYRMAEEQCVTFGVLLERALDALEQAKWDARGPRRGGGSEGSGAMAPTIDGITGTRRVPRNKIPLGACVSRGATGVYGANDMRSVPNGEGASP